MPDWFYRTVTQPLLFRVPAVPARDFALGFLGRLGAVAARPGGRSTSWDTCGPTPAAASLPGASTSRPRWASAPGSTPRRPPCRRSPGSASAFLEVGPVTPGADGGRPVARRPEQEAVWSPDPPASLSLAAAVPRLAEASRLGLPLSCARRPAGSAGAGCRECGRMIRELAPHVHLFSLDTLPLALAAGWSAAEWAAHLNGRPRRRAKPPARPVLLCVPADLDPSWRAARRSRGAGRSRRAARGRQRARREADGRLIGGPAREPALAQVRRWRDRYGRTVPDRRRRRPRAGGRAGPARGRGGPRRRWTAAWSTAAPVCPSGSTTPCSSRGPGPKPRPRPRNGRRR